MKKNNGLSPEAVFLTITLFLAAMGFLVRREYNFIYNSIVIYFGYLLLNYLESRNKFKVKRYIRVLVIITVLLHNIFGQYFNMYKTIIWFDKMLHLFGTFSFALFFSSILELTIGISHESKIYTFIMVTSIGVTVGVFLENIEFILDVFMKTKTQHGVKDINLDLIFNVVGSAIAGVFLSLRKNNV
ncbi:hypothetical protein R9X47_10055 [Wukongibacter baidiensis]|uniref:hypothetical protein n=1 Tax=Wukongibacter baidiensis TaxID=1723361 RepID=UPI003D7F4512